MFPLILVSHDKKLIEKYLTKFIQDNNFLSYNIFRISPLKKELSINQIRDIKKIISIENKENRLYIIYSFNSSTLEAQNALLKSLEEKTERNQFILITSNEYAVLPTIRSRSKLVYLNEKKKNNADESVLNFIRRLEKSSGYDFLSDKNLINISREDTVIFIDDIIGFYENRLVDYGVVGSEILKKAMKIKALIESNYLNSQISVDNLLISIKKLYKMK